jgi:hypothetical protein
MIKGTTSRASWTAFALLALGCGGRAENQVSASAGGSSAAGAPSTAIGEVTGSSGTPGIGPIDPTGLPTQLRIECPGTSPPPLALPCKIGNTVGGANFLECYDLAGKTALQSIVLLTELVELLNEPVPFPTESIPPPLGSEILKLTGTAVYTQVDPVGRAFVARLTGGVITWVGGPNGETLTCPVPETPLWAVAGDFN